MQGGVETLEDVGEDELGLSGGGGQEDLQVGGLDVAGGGGVDGEDFDFPVFASGLCCVCCRCVCVPFC